MLKMKNMHPRPRDKAIRRIMLKGKTDVENMRERIKHKYN